MRRNRRPLKLSRETLRRLNGDLNAAQGGTFTVIIDVTIEATIKTAMTNCPTCAVSCARTCTVDPASACPPTCLSVRCETL